jgi:hypothetical protein
MRPTLPAPVLTFAGAALIAACSAGAGTHAAAGGQGGGTSTKPPTGVGGASVTGSTGVASGTGGASATGVASGTGGASATGSTTATGGTPPDAGPSSADTLADNRDRLLGTYLAFLQSYATSPQSNGLSGSNVSTVCDIWAQLDPSSRAVFLTLTARMQGSVLGDDGSSMLSHIVKLYRVSGGQGATASDPGSCGGGEYNRLIMSMDAHLLASQNAAFDHQGAVQASGKRDIADIPAASFWRDSHDLGGPHAPFDRSDETDQGAPRGQTQYFTDPTATAATAPLGRLDLTTLVDPYAVEMDQDYDCVHNSNPLCTYVTYGPACFPEASLVGTAVYTKSYGDFDPGWIPAGCGD